MGIQSAALHVLVLALFAANASALPKDFMSNDVDTDGRSSSKAMKQMEYKLDRVKEDYQVMKEELSRTTSLVEELKKELLDLKRIVMDRDRQSGGMFYDYPETDPQPSIKEVVEEYNRSTNWRVLKDGLESLLDHDRVEYQQLEDVNDHSWGHLWQVGSKGFEELATLLLDSGMSPNKTDNKGDSILHGAAEGGRLQVAQLMVARGADIDERGWRGLTPFHKAALGGRPEMVKWLADQGADVNRADDNGMTSLHFAAEHGHMSVVQLLVEMGLDTKVKDNRDWTAFNWAQSNDHSSVAEFLSRYPH